MERSKESDFGPGPSPGATVWRRLRAGIALALAIALVYLGLLWALESSTVLVIGRGDSMEPSFRTGDVLLTSSVAARDIRVGDVVVFTPPSAAPAREALPDVMAHRVVALDADGAELEFMTKGDNAEVDGFWVPAHLVRGVVVRNVGPWARPFLVVSDTPVLLLALPAAAVLYFVLTLMAGSRPRGTVTQRSPQAAAEELREYLERWCDTVEGEEPTPGWLVTPEESAVDARARLGQLEEWADGLLSGPPPRDPSQVER